MLKPKSLVQHGVADSPYRPSRMKEVVARLVAAMQASGSKRWHIAKLAGMSETKLSKILNGKQVLTLADFLAIAKALEEDPSRFLTEGEMVVDVKKLEEAHRLSRQLDELLADLVPIQAASPIISRPKPAPDRTGTPVRAAANPNAEMVVEYEAKRKTIPMRAWNRGARIIVRVVGDSMDGGADPIRDGELAYLKKTRSPRMANGRVTLVRRDDGLYLKTLEISGHRARLVSANTAHDTIEIDLRGENMQTYGFVVDHQPERQR